MFGVGVVARDPASRRRCTFEKAARNGGCGTFRLPWLVLNHGDAADTDALSHIPLCTQEQIEMNKLRLTAAVNGTFVDKYCRNGKVHSVHMRISPDRYGPI